MLRLFVLQVLIMDKKQHSTTIPSWSPTREGSDLDVDVVCCHHQEGAVRVLLYVLEKSREGAVRRPLPYITLFVLIVLVFEAEQSIVDHRTSNTATVGRTSPCRAEHRYIAGISILLIFPAILNL